MAECITIESSSPYMNKFTKGYSFVTMFASLVETDPPSPFKSSVTIIKPLLTLKIITLKS